MSLKSGLRNGNSSWKTELETNVYKILENVLKIKVVIPEA